ncbi:hypothetical protein AB833_29610 [Chromatiales bacterium (ex Bugula neritina AB1)]|nr:hypothetical protein AB833_29610 [Chromatiales bacterium (ex Bugula neritina AB1)]
MKKVAIHQANFFPWLPFFHKLASVDHFVLLDDVQYERTGAGSWQNRVRLAFQGNPYWLTCPLDRSVPKTAQIREMRIQADPRWKKKAINTLQLQYKKAPHFEAAFPLVQELILNDTSNLAHYNEHAIRRICQHLELTTIISLSSDLNIQTTGTQRLIDLVKASDGDTYFAGRNAARTYQENEAFDQQGIELVLENYSALPYAQLKTTEFVSGLSIIDALMNVGAEETVALLQIHQLPDHATVA